MHIYDNILHQNVLSYTIVLPEDVLSKLKYVGEITAAEVYY